MSVFSHLSPEQLTSARAKAESRAASAKNQAEADDAEADLAEIARLLEPQDREGLEFDFATGEVRRSCLYWF